MSYVQKVYIFQKVYDKIMNVILIYNLKKKKLHTYTKELRDREVGGEGYGNPMQ